VLRLERIAQDIGELNYHWVLSGKEMNAKQNIGVAPDNEFPVTFRSILFKRMYDNLNPETSGAPAFLRDLNLDQVIDAVTAGRKEYNLTPLLYMPLSDVDAIKYRQEIFRDLGNEVLMETIKSFAQKMVTTRQYLALVDKLDYKNFREGWFLDAAEVYCDTINCLLQDLSHIELKSRGFLAFRDYMTHYIGSDDFQSLLVEMKRLKTALSTIKYAVIINGLRISVRKYEGETDYSVEVEQTFEKFKQGVVKDYRVELYEGSTMNHVEAQILDFVAKLFPDIFSKLALFCVQHSHFLDETIGIFDREIQFYIAYLEFIAKFKQAGLKFCLPQISHPSKEIYNYEGFDLALANKLVNERSSVVCNDFYLKNKERVFVVSGPNQGGKTTFARTFGQLHYLASLGCPVPGREARLFLFDRLFTHFEKVENIEDLRGKLEDDLVRIYDILNQSTSNSIIVINEIFTSTTLKDAIFLSKEVMEKLLNLESLAVWVTFVEELASFREQTVSMVSAVVPENPALRTFKIIRKPADGLSYAISIAEKYRLTYKSLKERIRQ
jgi:DNA mismatch repair protein MutS